MKRDNCAIRNIDWENLRLTSNSSLELDKISKKGLKKLIVIVYIPTICTFFFGSLIVETTLLGCMRCRGMSKPWGAEFSSLK